VHFWIGQDEALGSNARMLDGPIRSAAPEVSSRLRRAGAMSRRLQMVESSRALAHHHSVPAVCCADKHVDAGAALTSLLLVAPWLHEAHSARACLARSIAPAAP
jgi:hypothetical protein